MRHNIDLNKNNLTYQLNSDVKVHLNIFFLILIVSDFQSRSSARLTQLSLLLHM